MAPEFKPLIPYFVNFALVVALLYGMLRGSVRKFVYQRHERMRDAIEAAAIAHRKAADRAEGAKRKLAGLEGETLELAKKEGSTLDLERREILDKAQAEVQRLAREAERLSAVEQDEASDRVKGQFLDLVIHEAEQTLQRSLKKDDHSAILKRAQNSIEVGV